MGRSIAWFVFVVSCTSHHDVTSDGPLGDASTCSPPIASMAVDDACVQLASTRCQRLDACSPTQMRATWQDLATCQAREQLACTLELLEAGTGATAAGSTACAAAINAQTCDDFLTPTATPSACWPAAGSLANDDTCQFSSQCQSAFCGLDHVCRTEPKLGESCRAPMSGATIGCGPSLHCTTGVNSTCEAPVGVGEMCVANGGEVAPCAYGLYCAQAGVDFHFGNCQPWGTSANAGCGIFSVARCDEALGLACSTAFTCAEIVFVAAGASCDLIHWCDGGATCSGLSHTCIVNAADCSACDVTPSCTAPARCESSVCTF